jgi:hypothetical protein
MTRDEAFVVSFYNLHRETDRECRAIVENVRRPGEIPAEKMLMGCPINTLYLQMAFGRI